VRRSLVVLACLVASGCAPTPARVETPRIEALDKSYAVELPTGWIRQYTAEKNLIASRDGFLLQTIALVRRPLKEAFPRTKKVATTGMLPSELAELEIAELKLRGELTAALTVLENEPAALSGKEGFRVKVAYNNARGLEFNEVVYGVADESSMYRVTYRAPKLYYFDRYYPDFERAVQSFTLTKGKS
jgi:hypothetical protein